MGGSSTLGNQNALYASRDMGVITPGGDRGEEGEGGEGEGGRREGGKRPKVICSAILQKPKKDTQPFITCYPTNLFLF